LSVKGPAVVEAGDYRRVPSKKLQPPQFFFAEAKQRRSVLQHGVDVFVAHGVHTLRGVEIYKGKPIETAIGVIRVSSASTR